MIKRFIFFFLLVLNIFIFGCGEKETEVSKEVNFGDYSFKISRDFIYYSFSGEIKNLKDTKILYSFKRNKTNSFSDSLVIYSYKNDFPNSINKFFSIIIDKFLKYISGSKILETDSFSIKGAKIYYFIYNINNDIFGNTKDFTKYYGLQAYVFTNKQDVYIISYLSIDLESVKAILDAIKDLKFKEN